MSAEKRRPDPMHALAMVFGFGLLAGLAWGIFEAWRAKRRLQREKRDTHPTREGQISR